jgi:hypothetical protein
MWMVIFFHHHEGAQNNFWKMFERNMMSYVSPFTSVLFT